MVTQFFCHGHVIICHGQSIEVAKFDRQRHRAARVAKTTPMNDEQVHG